MNFRRFIGCFIFIYFSMSLGAQVLENETAAFKIASKNNQYVLMVFSGSDWCQPCIRFKKEVLDNSEFIHFATTQLVILNVDFPQRKKQPDTLIKQNELLAEQYNPQGYFPQIILFDADHSTVNKIPYAKQSAEEFIQQLQLVLPKSALKEYKKRISAMGSFFEFIVVDSVQNEKHAWKLLEDCESEVNRIEDLISEWIPGSEISQVNKYAGKKPVKVSDELYKLIQRSIHVGNLTQGAFDISFHSLDGLWKFDGSQVMPADSMLIKSALNKIGYQKIQLLDSNRVFLPVEGMSIGFGGIGQGYAVDKLKELLNDQRVNSFVVNSSGDIYAQGHRSDGSAWKIGIANPFKKEEIIRWLSIDKKAVVTSGNYEKYFEYNGERYAHIINPKTGWPAQGIMSATVINKYAEVADALATSIFVLGAELGLNLINQLPETHCIIIDDNKNVFYSQDLTAE